MQHESQSVPYGAELPVRGGAEVIVAGGGIAGVSAAIAARRNAASVLLLEKTISLGGLATLGNVIMYLPICDGMGHQVIGGIAEELLRLSAAATGPDIAGRHAGRATIPDPWLKDATPEERASKRYAVEFNSASFILALETLLKEEGVEIVYDTVCVDTIESDHRIKHVVVADKGGLCTYRCDVVIDATGDADVCRFAGEQVVSREGNVRCGWFYYTDRGTLAIDHMTESYSTDPSVVPGGSLGFACVDGRSVTAQVMGSRDLIRSRIAERARNHGSDSVVPVSLPQVPTFRMTHRLKGRAEPGSDAAQQDTVDAVGKTGDWRKAGPVYFIPFGALYGRTANLLVAGRIISVADDLWDVTRAIPTCAMTGQAAGCAAALCVKRGGWIDSIEVAELRRVLSSQGALL